MVLKHTIAVALIGAALAGVAFAQAVPPLPDAIKPIRMSGVGLNVSDLERSMKFYTEVLGFKVASRQPAQGPASEYLLGFTGQVREDNLVVLRKGAVEPGAKTFGRILLVVPNGKALAERVVAAGYPMDRPLAATTNFVRDPDGYLIELYQRPAPAPK
jgi:catechol 2,3-dioxygenase-like lactoylglutathione lyase family enzyme